jgi:hypothetical protein
MADVARSGDVVRRSTGHWTPAVHALLRHLENVGFDRAPRVIGIDDEGRELLSYLPGEVAEDWVTSEEVCLEGARLLRRYHDAVATFPIDSVSGWNTFGQESPNGDIVCHNDFAIYNCLFVDGVPWGMIDFDAAAPGSRAWDLAYSAFSFIPLNPDVEVPDRSRRLRLMCDAYGLESRTDLVRLILVRVEMMRDGIRALLRTQAPQADRVRDHLPFYERSLRFIQAERSRLEAGLK